MPLLHLNDTNFSQETAGAGLALVDFWAPWCGPCRVLGPLIEEIARDYAGRVRVAKLDTDESPDTALRFDVSAIPTVVLLQDGREVKRWVAVQPKSVYTKALDHRLNASPA